MTVLEKMGIEDYVITVLPGTQVDSCFVKKSRGRPLLLLYFSLESANAWLAELERNVFVEDEKGLPRATYLPLVYVVLPEDSGRPTTKCLMTVTCKDEKAAIDTITKRHSSKIPSSHKDPTPSHQIPKNAIEPEEVDRANLEIPPDGRLQGFVTSWDMEIPL